MADERKERIIQNGNHALLIGMIFGALESLDKVIPTKVELVVDERDQPGNQLRLTRASGTYLVTVDVEQS